MILAEHHDLLPVIGVAHRRDQRDHDDVDPAVVATPDHAGVFKLIKQVRGIVHRLSIHAQPSSVKGELSTRGQAIRY